MLRQAVLTMLKPVIFLKQAVSAGMMTKGAIRKPTVMDRSGAKG